jgi:hypothetical protein
VLGESGYLWLAHERAAFGDPATVRLLSKANACARFAATVYAGSIDSGAGGAIVVQELGGFLSVLTAYLCARRANLHHVFLEPALFKGRLLLVRNSFEAEKDFPTDGQAVIEAAINEARDMVAQKRIAIPVKDRHHYKGALSKLVNVRAARRLLEKTWDKVVLRKHQEFSHIGHHVRTHVRMLYNAMKLRRYYRGEVGGGRVVYFPFHVPADVALTLRSRAYFDQLGLVERLLMSLPPGWRLLVKEHPAMIGALSANRLIDLLAAYPSLQLAAPGARNFDVMEAVDVVVSVNSKSGAEALLLGKPVLVLGDAFYLRSGLVTEVGSPEQAMKMLDALVGDGRAAGVDQAMLARFLSAVWQKSVPGELYTVDPANADRVAAALLAEHARVAAS